MLNAASLILLQHQHLQATAQKGPFPFQPLPSALCRQRRSSQLMVGRDGQRRNATAPGLIPDMACARDVRRDGVHQRRGTCARGRWNADERAIYSHGTTPLHGDWKPGRILPPGACFSCFHAQSSSSTSSSCCTAASAPRTLHDDAIRHRNMGPGVSRDRQRRGARHGALAAHGGQTAKTHLARSATKSRMTANIILCVS